MIGVNNIISYGRSRSFYGRSRSFLSSGAVEDNQRMTRSSIPTFNYKEKEKTFGYRVDKLISKINDKLKRFSKTTVLAFGLTCVALMLLKMNNIALVNYGLLILGFIFLIKPTIDFVKAFKATKKSKGFPLWQRLLYAFLQMIQNSVLLIIVATMIINTAMIKEMIGGILIISIQIAAFIFINMYYRNEQDQEIQHPSAEEVLDNQHKHSNKFADILFANKVLSLFCLVACIIIVCCNLMDISMQGLFISLCVLLLFFGAGIFFKADSLQDGINKIKAKVGAKKENAQDLYQDLQMFGNQEELVLPFGDINAENQPNQI